MSTQKVSDLIIEKFADKIKEDTLFGNISQELTTMLKEGKHNKDEIERLLKKRQNENT